MKSASDQPRKAETRDGARTASNLESSTIIGTNETPGPETDLSGRTLGKYELRRKLGAGGMGAVYLGFDPGIEREVAVKVLPASGNEVMTKRFLAEARAAGRLSHLNAVQVFDIGESDGLNFIVMELVTGGSISERVANEGKLSFKEACRVVIEAGRGLVAAHGQGLVHRDVKPENLMLADDGTVKLVDFGLSKAVGLDVEAKTALTMQGQVLGTPHYMSPEQYTGSAVDERSDVYSLGATFHSLLTGEYPFPGESVHQIMYAHLEGPRPDPRSAVPELPEGCTKIVAKAMARRPADRHQRMVDFVSDVEGLLSRGANSVQRGAVNAADVLIVEPSKLQSRVVADAFRQAQAERVVCIGLAAEVAEVSSVPSLVVTARHLPDGDALAVLERLRTGEADPYVVISTSDDLNELGKDVPVRTAFVSKSVRPDRLVRLVSTLEPNGLHVPAEDVPADVSVALVTRDGMISTELAETVRAAGVVDVTVLAQADRDSVSDARFDLIIAVDPEDDLTTVVRSPDREVRTGFAAAVRTHDGSPVVCSVRSPGVVARCDRKLDVDGMRKLLALATSA